MYGLSYEKICKNYGCKEKVFPKEKGCLRKKPGNSDLMILFTNTVSHKMVNSAVVEAKRIRFRLPEHIPAVQRYSRMYWRATADKEETYAGK